jgi:hypothetical protein
MRLPFFWPLMYTIAVSSCDDASNWLQVTSHEMDLPNTENRIGPT